MKKILMTLMASMLLLSSTTYAQGAVTHNTSFSKKDAQALFGTNKVKATTLNNGEMAKTEAEGIWGAWFGASAYTGYNIGGYMSTGQWGGTMSGFAAAVGSGFALSPW